MQNHKIKLVQNLKNEIRKVGDESLEIIKKCKHSDSSGPDIDDLLMKSININKYCHNIYNDLRYLESELRESIL